MRTQYIMPALFIAVVVALSLAFSWAIGPDNEQATYGTSTSSLPAKGTIACRDAQIARLRSMLVHVDNDPFKPHGYSDANETVTNLLMHAEQLQNECK
jgi:hypothetical protein